MFVGALGFCLYLPEQVQILSKQLGDRPGSPRDIEAPPTHTQVACFDVFASRLTHLVFYQEGENERECMLLVDG